MGYPNNNWYGYVSAPTVAGGGLTPTVTRNNADGSTTVLNGGTSTISLLASQAISVNGNNMVATAYPAGSTIVGVNGAAAYAWYWNGGWHRQRDAVCDHDRADCYHHGCGQCDGAGG